MQTLPCSSWRSRSSGLSRYALWFEALLAAWRAVPDGQHDDRAGSVPLVLSQAWRHATRPPSLANPGGKQC